jgi:hypothetical protein
VTEQSSLDAQASTKFAKNPDSTAEQLQSAVGISAAIDRLLAKHSNASPALLEELSHSSDKATRKNVVLNPNSPKAVLIKLAQQFPGDFFKNPAFDWLLLEDPNLLFEIVGGVLKSILKRPECPVSFMNWAVAHGNEQEKLAVAMNAEAPVDALRKLVEAGGSLAEAARGHERIRDEQDNQDPLVVLETHIRAALGGLNSKQARSCWNRGLIGPAQWAALSPKARREALSISSEFFVIEWLTGRKAILANDRNPEVRRAVAGDPTCSVKLMKQLGEDQDVDVRLAVARNSGCPAPVLEMLANDQVVAVREAVAENPACPLVVLEALAKDAEGYVSWSVARNPSCPVAVLEALAKTGNSLVLSDIARHPSCPELLRASVLEVLLNNGNRYGRQDVAKNPSCPVTLLEVLAKDMEEAVRREVAMNQSCPVALLEILAKDENRMVRRGVAESSLCPVELLEVLVMDEDEYVRRNVAKHPSCPELLRWPVLEALAKEGNMFDRQDVAENPFCPVALLETLATDEDKKVRCGVAVNPACPVALLKKLAQDGDEKVRRGVAENPSCPSALLDVLAKDRNRDVRVASAKHPSCPSEALERLTQDKASAVRSQAVVHPRCPVAPEVLAMSAHSDVLRALGNNDQYPPSIRMTIQARLLGYAYQAVAEESGSASLEDRLLSSDEGEVLTAFREELSSLLLQPQSSMLAQLIGADRGETILQLRDDLADVAAKSSMPWLRLVGLHHRSTSPEILAKRSKSTDWMDRLAVACNPSSPQKILAQLKNDPHRLVAAASQYGEEGKRLAVARQADAQGRYAVLNIAPVVEEIRRRFSESTTLEKIDELVHGCWQSSIAEWQLIPAIEAAAHPNVRAGLLERLAKNQDDSVRSEVAGNPNTRAGLLEIMAKDREQVRWYLARNTACPATVLVALAKDREESVREQAMGNPEFRLKLSAALSAAGMEKMVNSLVKRVKHENYQVRKTVAKNPFCPPALLEVLVRDAEEVVGWAVVSNPSCPAALLEEFATNDSRYSDMWKCAVAENPACATATLEILANDSSALVRSRVAQHPAISTATLERLAKYRGLQEDIARNPACPPELLEVLAKELRLQEGVARNPACPPALLEALAKNPNSDVRHAACRRPACPMVALNAFVESGDPWMVWLAIHNDNATPEQLLHWASDSGLHPALRLSCVLRPKFPASAKALADEVTVLADAPPQPLSSVSDAEWILALQALKLYPDPEDKRAVTKAAKSSDWLQRVAATFCSSIQPNQIKLLLDDPEEIVRQLAAQRLNGPDTAREMVDRVKKLQEAEFSTLKTPCPKCGGVIQEGDKKFECKSCDYSNLKVLAGRQWEPEELDGLLSNRVIGPMSGFRDKRGRPFQAMVKLNAAHEPELCFDHLDVVTEAVSVDFSALTSVGACPKCGNHVYEHGRNYLCEKSVGPAAGCDFHSSKIILQQEISQTEMQKLLGSGKTSLLTGFVANKTRRTFSAYLVCDATTGKISFEF